MNTVLIKPLPYPDADRIVILGYTFNGNWVPWTSEAKFNIWRNHSASFDQLAGVRFQRVGLDDGRNADQIESGHVSAAFFSLFGAALEHLLFGVTPHDPLAFALAALVLAAVAAIATLAPVHRAAQLNPLDILRMN